MVKRELHVPACVSVNSLPQLLYGDYTDWYSPIINTMIETVGASLRANAIPLARGGWGETQRCPRML
jgi:hypothetical protein